MTTEREQELEVVLGEVIKAFGSQDPMVHAAAHALAIRTLNPPEPEPPRADVVEEQAHAREADPLGEPANIAETKDTEPKF